MTHNLVITRAYRLSKKPSLAILYGIDDVSGALCKVFCPYEKFDKLCLDSLDPGHSATYIFEGKEVKFRYHKDKNSDKYYSWVVD